jgi:NAD-reducing hydrogenase large subunit
MEPQKIVIHPVTRVEGHAKITLQLDAEGKVADARFHVDEFRGFEKFCEGRYFTEMPVITPRICGICPVSHAVASVRACEKIMAVDVPRAAELLRKLIHLGQVVSSHALSFFYLASPDFLLGWDSDPAKRNILGVAEMFPELARRGIRLRKFGQEISERITGKKIHSGGIVAGGMATRLTQAHRDALLAWIPEILETAAMGLEHFRGYADNYAAESKSFASFPTLFLAMAGPGGSHALYEGKIRVKDADGEVVAENLAPEDYLDYIAERPVEWSYLKFPYFKAKGFPDGFYRVGPLARLNVADRMATPRAQKEFESFKALGGGKPVLGSFYYHHARLIEILTAVEQIHDLLQAPEILSTHLLVQAGRNQARGVGCTEAPRGTLFHDYVTDPDGVLRRVNLLIATGQNNPAMNRAILEVARTYVDGRDLKESALNRVEAAIRCYDPCLSCSTHAVGAMPLAVEVVGPGGEILNVVRRSP